MKKRKGPCPPGRGQFTRCRLCGTELLSRNLPRHLAEVHREGSVPLLRCRECPYRTIRQRDLTRHQYRAHPKLSGFVGMVGQEGGEQLSVNSFPSDEQQPPSVSEGGSLYPFPPGKEPRQQVEGTGNEREQDSVDLNVDALSHFLDLSNLPLIDQEPSEMPAATSPVEVGGVGCPAIIPLAPGEPLQIQADPVAPAQPAFPPATVPVSRGGEEIAVSVTPAAPAQPAFPPATVPVSRGGEEIAVSVTPAAPAQPAFPPVTVPEDRPEEEPAQKPEEDLRKKRNKPGRRQRADVRRYVSQASKEAVNPDLEEEDAATFGKAVDQLLGRPGGGKRLRQELERRGFSVFTAEELRDLKTDVKRRAEAEKAKKGATPPLKARWRGAAQRATASPEKGEWVTQSRQLEINGALLSFDLRIRAEEKETKPTKTAVKEEVTIILD